MTVSTDTASAGPREGDVAGRGALARSVSHSDAAIGAAVRAFLRMPWEDAEHVVAELTREWR
jgi:hypothetical protein